MKSVRGNTYRNGESEQKHITREILLTYLRTLGLKKPRVLSLPHINFTFEKMVKNIYKSSIIDCVEFNKDVYRKALENPDHQIVNSYREGNIFHSAADNSGYYDFIWLDLCSHLTLEVFNQIIATFQNHLKKNSIIAVTLCGAREYRMKVYCDRYKTTSEKFRKNVFPKTLIKLTGPNLELLDIINYKAEYTNSAPMHLYIFKNK